MLPTDYSMSIWRLICFFHILIISGQHVSAKSVENAKITDDFLNYSLQQLTETKVTVASLSAEKVSEAPVPVSLITSQMIESSGALTLKDLLLTYVPGFTNVEDQNEINIAARGVYTSSQQKILILINGHRINSRSYSMASPDYSIALNKVKQIEVLRGPASSLYGNVSLTATINIILKNGRDNSGSNLSLLHGNHGQNGVSFLVGNSFSNSDVIVWGQTYQADGEKITLNPADTYSANPVSSTAILGGIKDKSSYDVGVNWRTSYGDLFVNQRRSHYVEPFSGGGLSGEPYDYSQFDKIGGYSPGIGFIATHAEYKNLFSLADWQNETRIYWDNLRMKASLVVDPSAPVFGAPRWKDQSFGVLSTIQQSTSNGTILVGGQLEYYQVYDDEFQLGVNSYRVNTKNDELLSTGSESNYSVFMQYKHRINTMWQANFGLRYDYKNRKQTKNVDEVSPRLGLLYQHQNTSVKFSYSQAFVDANYWNRFSNLASFKGASNLKPEKLRSWQISPSFTLPKHNLQITSNLFFDQAIDTIYRDNSATSNNYSNAGRLNSWGVEQEINYITNQLTVRLNGTFRQVSNSEKIATDNGYISNVPKFTANIIIEAKLNDKVGLHTNVQYIGKQFSPIIIQQDGQTVDDPFPDQGVNYYQPNHYENNVWLVNSNIDYKVSDNVAFNLRVENIFDRQYNQGGTTLHPYPQKGRWAHIQVTYTF